jgi:hypothetical protein
VARPVGHGCAVDDQRAGDVGIGRRQQHGGPATLAVAHNDGGRCIGVAAHNFTHKTRFGPHHVGQGLAFNRALTEHHKVHRVPGLQRHAHLAVFLEAADARTVAGTGVDDHVRSLPVMHRHALRGQDVQQLIVHRVGQLLSIDHQFVVIHQHGWGASGLVGQVVVAAFAQGVQRQGGALQGIHPVGLRLRDPRAISQFRLQRLAELFALLAQLVVEAGHGRLDFLGMHGAGFAQALGKVVQHGCFVLGAFAQVSRAEQGFG